MISRLKTFIQASINRSDCIYINLQSGPKTLPLCTVCCMLAVELFYFLLGVMWLQTFPSVPLMVPVSLGHLQWGNALTYKLEVGVRRSPKSHCTLFTTCNRGLSTFSKFGLQFFGLAYYYPLTEKN